MIIERFVCRLFFRRKRVLLLFQQRDLILQMFDAFLRNIHAGNLFPRTQILPRSFFVLLDLVFLDLHVGIAGVLVLSFISMRMKNCLHKIPFALLPCDQMIRLEIFRCESHLIECRLHGNTDTRSVCPRLCIQGISIVQSMMGNKAEQLIAVSRNIDEIASQIDDYFNLSETDKYTLPS